LPEQVFVLETDPSVARRVARSYMSWYLGVENYRKSLLLQGFADEDLAGEGSDRLVDAIVAWGDKDAVRSRVQEHFDAGATHVSVQAIAEDSLSLELEAYRRVAPALVG
jgi:probable F420-dependent oxidoreductase